MTRSGEPSPNRPVISKRLANVVAIDNMNRRHGTRRTLRVPKGTWMSKLSYSAVVMPCSIVRLSVLVSTRLVIFGIESSHRHSGNANRMDVSGAGDSLIHSIVPDTALGASGLFHQMPRMQPECLIPSVRAPVHQAD
jgi:hypothetical protein